MNVETIHSFMGRSYWAAKRTKETVEKSIQNSLCFGVFSGDRQVAFARIVTDYCTFAYLCDVFVDEEFRGRGISKWIMEKIMAYPSLQGLRRIALATKDAHGLYSQYGFKPMSEDEQLKFMVIRNDTV